MNWRCEDAVTDRTILALGVRKNWRLIHALD